MSTPVRRCLVALVVAGSAAGCATTRTEDPNRRVDLVVPTTAPTTDCELLAAAERAVADASLTAFRADDATKAGTRARLAELRRQVPSSLASAVDVIGRAFEAAWATPRSPASDGLGATTADPFESAAYLRADQSIRQRVVAICGSDAGSNGF